MSLSIQAYAWDNHKNLTSLATLSYDNWETVTYEPVDAALPGGQKLADFIKTLNINGDFVKWEWIAPVNQESAGAAGRMLSMSAREVLLYSVDEPDVGMDQNLNISPDQKYMGGFSGLSSQGIRHMYFGQFRPESPMATFHVPTRALGLAPERVELFFNLAKQAKNSGHAFWAYRFLGWGLHYLQDVSQPYHSSQVPSIFLLPFSFLFKGWDLFVLEATRVVANFHLAFEQYTEFNLNPERADEDLVNAFKVPLATPELKKLLEQKADLGILEGAVSVSVAAADLAGDVASTERKLFGAKLYNKDIDFRVREKDAAKLLEFAALESKSETAGLRKDLKKVTIEALSNMGVATRWYLDRFQAATVPK